MQHYELVRKILKTIQQLEIARTSHERAVKLASADCADSLHKKGFSVAQSKQMIDAVLHEIGERT